MNLEPGTCLSYYLSFMNAAHLRTEVVDPPYVCHTRTGDVITSTEGDFEVILVDQDSNKEVLITGQGDVLDHWQRYV